MAPEASPPPLAAHAMAYDSARGVSVLFGGSSTIGGLSSATWEWDGTNWTQRAIATSPPARVWAGVAFDSVRNRIVLVGGDGHGMLGDTSEDHRTRSGPLHP